MSCSVGERKRIQYAASSLRRLVPTAGVDVLAPAEGQHHAWSLEATFANVECVRSDVYGALLSEDLDLQLVKPRGEHYVVIATV